MCEIPDNMAHGAGDGEATFILVGGGGRHFKFLPTLNFNLNLCTHKSSNLYVNPIFQYMSENFLVESQIYTT